MINQVYKRQNGHMQLTQQTNTAYTVHIMCLLCVSFVCVRNVSSVSVSLRWEEEYTMRMDLQQKIADLQEVTLCKPVCLYEM